MIRRIGCLGAGSRYGLILPSRHYCAKSAWHTYASHAPPVAVMARAWMRARTPGGTGRGPSYSELSSAPPPAATADRAHARRTRP